MGKTFDALDYEYTMKEFVEILESGLYNGCSKEQYEDTLNTLIKLVRNSLVWRYNYRYFNIGFSNIDKCFRSIYAFDFLQNYCPIEDVNNFKLNNKCFFCDLWDPKRLFLPFLRFE